MAYWIQKTSSNHNISNYRYFICDYLSDIKKLPTFKTAGEPQDNDTISAGPCSYGSCCLCLEDSSKWILGKATNEWKKINVSTSGGGSSGGGVPDLDIATEDEVDDVLDDVFS